MGALHIHRTQGNVVAFPPQTTFRGRGRSLEDHMNTVTVWDCAHCGQHAVIYVTDRGQICMNCGEAK